MMNQPESSICSFSGKGLPLLLIVLFVLHFLLLPAQNPLHSDKPAAKIEWSANENSSSKFWYSKVLGTCEEGAFLLRSNLSLDNDAESQGFRSRKYAIDFYDKNFSFQWEKQIDLPEKGAHFERFLMMNDKVLVLYSVYRKKTGTLRLLGKWIEPKGISLMDPVELLSLNSIKQDEERNFLITQSSSQKILAITAPTPLMKDSLTEKSGNNLSLFGFDENLKRIAKKEITLRFSSEKLKDAQFLVSNDSIVFMAVQGGQNRSSGFSVSSYDLKKEQNEFTYVEAGEYHISESMFAIDDHNKNFVIAAFYSNYGNRSAAGTFFASLNFDHLSISVLKAVPFSESFLSLFIGEPKTSDKKELLNCKLNKVILKNKGGALLLGESEYTTEYSYYDFFTKTYVTRTVFHYDNVLVISIDASGNAEWEKSISKKQESQEDGGYYLSYIPVITGDHVFFLFNASDGKLNSVLAQKFNGQGEDVRSVLTPMSEDVTIIARAGKQTDMNELLIPCFRKNKFALAKLIF